MKDSKNRRFTLDNLHEIDLRDTLEVYDRDTGVTKTVKAVDRAEICSVIAYMIGVDINYWEKYYSYNYSAILTKLQKDRNATIIRYLSRIRTVFMNNFLEVNADLMNLVNIDRNDKFSSAEI